MTKPPLLSIENLSVGFPSGRGYVLAVNEVGFSVKPGELVGVVGESGSGKSVTALAIMGLLPPAARITGRLLFEGRDLLGMSAAQLRQLRGREIGMIFQEPMTSLNPVFTVGDQIIEAVRAQGSISRKAALERAVALLDQVGIPSARRRLEDYPHQMSGGMRQRIMIAIALAGSPRLLIADEPTTALDVTIQAQLLDLLNQLREELGMAIVLISHNMGVMAEIADKVVVMYASRVVEEADIFQLFDAPQHPYSAGLLGSTPDMGSTAPRLITIPGSLPSPGALPEGCLFAPRCPKAIDACLAAQPPLFELGHSQKAACIRAPARPAEVPA
jgi:oligopeptide/dipeptide ABC transporter ATP-binding protein